MQTPLTTFQNQLSYTFNDPSLLVRALTHKSFAFENGNSSHGETHNERFEFLGDAVLDLVVADLLMKDEKASEGELSRRRAALVNEKTLSQVARLMGLCDQIILGKGESQSQGTQKDSILASALEAVIGAIYLDGGLDQAKKTVEKYFSNLVATAAAIVETDHKSKLQEKWQALSKTAPFYKLDHSEGPDHQKTFYVSVYVGEKKLGEGVGKSRKEAEQKAAANALEMEAGK